jgi:membrane protease YdiL (CAAX protease family)
MQTSTQLFSCIHEVNQLDLASVSAGRHKPTACRGLIVASVLVVSRLSYFFLNSMYQAHLLRNRQFALADFYLFYSDVGASLLILTELLLFYLILRPRAYSEHKERPIVPRSLLWQCVVVTALGTGLSLLLVRFTPMLLEPFELAHLIVDTLLFSPKLFLLVALLLALVFLGEIVFRDIMFSVWREKIGTVPALLACSLVFAVSWPLTGALSAFFIGLTAGVLFSRTNRIWPGILANLVATLACIGVLIWRLVTGGHVP